MQSQTQQQQTQAASERNNSKSLPDLTDEESSTKLLQELKSVTLLRANMAQGLIKFSYYSD
jgi:hypothetical protein